MQEEQLEGCWSHPGEMKEPGTREIAVHMVRTERIWVRFFFFSTILL